MGIIIGLIPALLWGFAPLLLTRFVRGGSYVQMIGVGNGIAAFSVVVTLILRPQIPAAGDWILCFLSGATWMVGMYGQLIGYRTIGISRTFPLSTGVQIIGNALLGWLVLGEWKGARQILSGLVCTAIVMAGILVSNGKAQGEQPSDTAGGQSSGSRDAYYILLVILTSFGYCLYSLLPKLTKTTDSMSQSLPQSLGILAGGLILAALFGRSALHKIPAKFIVTASAVGLWYGIASFAFLISISMNGMIRGFLLSQLNMIIATLSGIYILREPQKVPLWRSYAGMAAILAGCIAIQFI